MTDLYGQVRRLPGGVSIALASMDFETFSAAGYVWDVAGDKWVPLPGARDKGLSAIGHRVYAEHPSTEVLTLSYSLLDGRGKRRWRPGQPLPFDLFTHLAGGRLIEAHKSAFEQAIWNLVCVPRYGFPPLDPRQLRCSMSKSRAWGLPGALGKAGEVLALDVQKDAEGKRLIQKFCMPRKPTKKDPSVRHRPETWQEDGESLYRYCDQDIDTEHALSAVVPDLSPVDLQFWLADQAINWRGVGVDLPAVLDCRAVLNEALDYYAAECERITGGVRPSQVQALIGWLAGRGVATRSLDDDALTALLADQGLPADARQVLGIRQLSGSASVKKLYAMANHANRDGRLCDLYNFNGARTGRDTHSDVQPGNLPKAGPDLRWCENDGCGKPYGRHLENCPWCGASVSFSRQGKWGPDAVDHALAVMKWRSFDVARYFFGDVLLTLSGCIRGLLVAGEGKRLICSDYSSIEAVVTAVLAGEQWRIDAFARGEDIYLHGAASVTGNTYEWYQANGGKKHPDRQKIGKPAELGLGFGGWISAWRVFDSTDTYNDYQVEALIVKWREASPMLVELWGGQVRGKPWQPERAELFGLEGMALAAILNPGHRFRYRLLAFEYLADDVLYMILPSGRRLAYHRPRLGEGRWPGTKSISYETWNSNPKMGPIGWVRMETYGARFTENAVQAVANDIFRHAIVQAERAGYPIVIRVHDELAAEVPEGWGSIAEFEAIMGDLPPWARGWPIRAAGGWEGRRYRKDD